MDLELAPRMLVVYVAWALVLGAVVMTWRFGLIMSGKIPADSLTHGKDHGSDIYWRANRSLINALENLPMFASIILIEQLVAAGTIGVFEYLAAGVVAARIIQTILHILSDGKLMVVLRFIVFQAQMIAMILMLLDLVTEDIFV